jgi:hypothetical protein
MANDDRASLNRFARVAGFLFLFYIAAGLGGTFITGGYLVKNDAVATTANINTSEFIYRIGLLLQFAGSLTAVGLGWALYVLLRSIDRNWAMLALLFRVAEGTVGAIGSVFGWTALALYTGRGFQGGNAASLIDLATLASRAAFPLAVTFFSLGSFIFFVLLTRTQFIPKWLSLTGVVGSVCSLLLGLGLLLLPAAPAALQLLWLPLLVAEVGTGILWLARGVGTASTRRGV